MRTTGIGIVAAALLAAGFFCGCGEPGPSAASGKGCNILLVTIDTVRADHIGCYGCKEAKTSAIDALAAKGVLFEEAFSAVPITLPSHATIMTGLFPPEHGVRENEDLTLSPDAVTMAEFFESHGYATGAFVGAFVLDSAFGLGRGFETYDDAVAADSGSVDPADQERPADKVVDAALKWLGGLDGSAPFFCWVHLYDPHAPYRPPQPYSEMFRDAPYDGEIAFADSQIDRLAGWLEEKGLRERTLVVVTGDHGEGLGEHDEPDHAVFLYGSTLHVPLVFSLPGVISEGIRVEALAGLVDLFPTLASFAGFSPPGEVSGRSLLAGLRGGKIESRDQYGETNYPFDYYGWSPLRSVTTPRWKYVRAPAEELYDRTGDPGETKNLAAAKPGVLDRMRGVLTRMEESMHEGKKKSGGALSDEERRRLEALGYMTGSSGQKAPADIGALEDPKDKTGVLNQWIEGLDLLREGRRGEAVEALQRLAAAEPGYAQLHSTLAALLAKEGRNGEAIEEFRRALAAHEKSGRKNGADVARIHNTLGGLLARRGKRGEAIPHFEKAIEIDPGYSGAYNNLGSALAQEGRLDEAVADFRSALRVDPGNGRARSNLGRALALSAMRKLAGKEYGGGVRLLREALAARPGDPRIMDLLARILASCPTESLREGAEAVRLAEAAVRMTVRRNPAFLDTLAIAYANAGRFYDARAAAEEALVLAKRSGNAGLVRDIGGHLELFRSGRPFRAAP